MVITPQGRVSRYFYGLEYSSRDIELGLIEAAEERIGSVVDAAVLFCYAYDPAAGKYSLVIMRVLRVAAVLTIAVLGTFLFVMIRRERRKPPLNPSSSSDASSAGGAPGSEILNPQ
jgi:protein SCO1/2